MSHKISVLMAAYNAATFIQKAVVSVQAQTHSDWELIIIDDGSTDNTIEVVEKLVSQDRRIRLLRLPVNGGPGKARNAGLAVAQGAWVTVLDADDAFAPDRLKVLLDCALERDLDIVADNHILFDSHAQQSMGEAFSLSSDYVPLTLTLYLMNDTSLNRFQFGCLQPFIKMSFVRRAGLNYLENIRIGEDSYFMISALMNTGKACLLAKPLYIYTVPFGAISKKRSSLSQTDYSYLALVSLIVVNEQLREKAQEMFPKDKKMQQAFQCRRLGFVDAFLFGNIKNEILERKNIFAAFSLINLSVLFYLAVKIKHRLFKSNAICKEPTE